MRHTLIAFLLPLALALFVAAPAFALPPQEEARVTAMLDALAKYNDVTFIRNGSNHTTKEAVAHLKLKLSRTRDRLSTAEQFVDKVASSSSITGKPYTVRTACGKEENAKDFLTDLLKQVAPK